ncbi:MAG: hypothetical protein AAF497_02610, partial [Planctomycetota bacterium]
TGPWTLRRNAADSSLLEFEDSSGVSTLGATDVLDEATLEFRGVAGQVDLLTIDYGNGFFGQEANILLQGNANEGDRLNVVGTGLTQATYQSTGGLLGNASIQLTEGSSSNSVAFTNLNTIDLSELISFEADGTLNIGSDALIVDATTTLLDIVTLINGGNFTVPRGVTLRAGQILQGNGNIDGPLAGEAGSVINATGDLQIGDNGSFVGFVTLGNITISNASTLTLLDRDKAILGALTNLDNSRLTAPNGLLLPNGSTVEVETGGGTIRTINGSETNDFEVEGTVFVEDGPDAIDLLVEGCITGSGQFLGPGTVAPTCISPGSSTGLVEFESLQLQNDSATLIELGGNRRGEEYDSINVSGSAIIDGSLHIVPRNNFRPKVGDSFVLLSGAYKGRFDGVALDQAYDGLAYRVEYRPTEVRLKFLRKQPTCFCDGQALQASSQNAAELSPANRGSVESGLSVKQERSLRERIFENFASLPNHLMWILLVSMALFLNSDARADLVTTTFENLALIDASTVIMEVGGTELTPTQQHDHIVINNTAHFDGTLQVELTNALGDSSPSPGFPLYVPVAGDSIQLFDLPASTTGSFDTLILPTLSSGLVWDTDHLTDPLSPFAGQLLVAIPEASQVTGILAIVFAVGLRRFLQRAASVGLA